LVPRWTGFDEQIRLRTLTKAQPALHVGKSNADQRFARPFFIFNSQPGNGVFRIDHAEAFQQTTHLRYQLGKEKPWVSFTWRFNSGLALPGRGPDYTSALLLTADQQVQMGLYCGDRFATGAASTPIPLLEVVAGEKIFLYGPSGSGKTTLLGVMAGVLAAQSGAVRVLGQDLQVLSGAQRDAFRGEHIGFIFQMFNLIPYLSVFNNIALPCRLHGGRMARLGRKDLTQAAADIANRLGIGGLLDERVLYLSVGQQQRVTAARALISEPELIIADEPTSSLDADHRDSFLRLLFENCSQTGSTVLFVSPIALWRPLAAVGGAMKARNVYLERGVPSGATVACWMSTSTDRNRSSSSSTLAQSLSLALVDMGMPGSW
jgi:putative ABC transport system ATP-binding protein